MACLMFFELKIILKIRLEGTGKEWVAMGMAIFMAVGVFHVELLACQNFNV